MNNSIKSSFKTKSFRVGGYNMVLIIALVAIVIVVNLVVNSLPSLYTKIDTSSNTMFSISEDTEEIIKAIDEDVTIYFIATTGSEDSIIDGLLGRYTSLNSHIKVKYIDPATNPSFVSQYTDDELSESSLIYVSEKRSTYSDYYDIYTTSYSDEELYNYYYYGTMPTGTTSFAGESEITGSIQYCTSDYIPKMYMLSGHGETELDSTIEGYVNNDNIETATVSLLTEESVPSDASVLLINNPTSDISTDELTKIRTYLDNGGKLILTTGYDTKELTNLFTLTSEYGGSYNSGLVLEGNKNYYMSGYPYYILPKIASNSISEQISNSNMYVFTPYAHGITQNTDAAGDSLTYTKLFSTSAAAYRKLDVENITTLEKLDEDPTGTVDTGVMLTDTDTNGCIVWFSSSYFLDSNCDQMVSSGNSTYFLTLLTELCDKPASVSIASKSMQVQALVMDDLSSNIWSAVFTIIIPVGVIAGGGIYWFKRRKA